MWRARSSDLQPYAPAAATAFARAADELEAALRQQEVEELSLSAAARESGYTRDHLSRLIREGKIPNAGRRNAPRIRRADLPRKPAARPRGGGVAAPDGQRYDPVADARALQGRRGDH
jgi:hypothetical protein